MRRTTNRRGVMLVLAAVFIVVVLSFLAVVADISRIYVQKNELQTAADAAALAAVLELNSTPANVQDSANSFAQKNLVFKSPRPALAADVTCQVYNFAANTLSGAGACDLSKNAVTVTVRDTAAWSMPVLFPRADKEVKATSTAYLGFVDASKCIKPWGIPYVALTKRLDPSNVDTLRDLNASDIVKLQTWTPAQLEFTVKYGSPTSPGNFGILQLPGSGNGSNSYRDDIINCNPAILSPGDTIGVDPGNRVGPTKQGAAGLCQPYDSSTGACFNSSGTVGLPVKAPMYLVPGSCNGNNCVIVIKAIISFSLDTVTSGADVIGHFLSFASSGNIGSTPSSVRRPILVR